VDLDFSPTAGTYVNSGGMKGELAERGWLSRCSWLEPRGCLIFLLCISPIIASLAFAIGGGIHPHMQYQTKFADNAVFDKSGRRIYRISYFGDSLIDFSDRDFGFVTTEINTLQNLFPNVAFDAYSSGISGDKVSNLLERVQRDVIIHNPRCIIVYFDSDASSGRDAMDDAVRQRYESNLQLLLGILTQQAPDCVALAGPSLHGEFPCGSGLNARDDIYDAYRDINERTALQFNVKFFNTRDVFCRKLREAGWMAYQGCFTFDGEHHNGAGCNVVSSLFLDYLVQKFTTILGQQ